jgi:hypothetical protein
MVASRYRRAALEAERSARQGLSMTQKRLQERSLRHLKPFLISQFQQSWEIELIIELHRNADLQVSAQSLSDKLNVEHSLVFESLQKLARNGLLGLNHKDQTYRYAPRTAELNALVALLAMAHSQNRVSLLRMLHD